MQDALSTDPIRIEPIIKVGDMKEDTGNHLILRFGLWWCVSVASRGSLVPERHRLVYQHP